MQKILFVEEESALQKALGDFLRQRGYEVISAFDGEAGFAAVRKERPNLVLLDLILPKKHGMDVFREMQADPATAAIPVIVLSNVEADDTIRQALELGAKAYLVKTNYSLDEVLEKVRAVLGS